MKTESDLRRLAKYSRHNASEKGRARVERYRATPSIIAADGRVLERKGGRNRWTSYMRILDKRIAAGEAALRERFGDDRGGFRHLAATAERIGARFVAASTKAKP